MIHIVTVAFGPAKEYEIVLRAADLERMDKEQGRAWLLREFRELECIPSNPMGKILIIDMVLQVAQYGGEERFEEANEWATTYATAVVMALERPVVKVDVPNFVVG